ncbi:hypothetical protein ACVWWG_004652 [Bradyrhizobium sp. LB7.2]
MKLLAFLFYQICFQALSPAHGCIYSPSAGAISRIPSLAILLAPFFFRKARQQFVLEKHDIDGLERLVESQSIKLLDDDEQFGQDGSANRQDTVSGFLHATKSARMLAEIMLEKLAEVLFQFRYPMRDVPHGNPFDLGRARHCFHRMNKALIDERNPKEDVGKRDRMATAFARFRRARGKGRTLCALRHLRLRDLGLLPHPMANLGAENERIPNVSLEKLLQRIRISNDKNLARAERELQCFVNGRRGSRMVALLVLGVLMTVCLELALDVRTRELVAFRISDSLVRAGAKVLLWKVAGGDSWRERQFEVDRFHLDGLIVPDSA